jgi:DNA-binding GntR family transcriptional regulator
MKKESSKTRAEQLAALIADAVLSGEFLPGFRLDEQMLALRFDVSRTPVREALRQLAATGLVEIRPRRGASVAQIDPNELEAMFVAMGELEATCARLAAMSMTPIERRRLGAFHESMDDLVKQDDRLGFAEANLQFHALIYAGTHNKILADMTAGLRRRLIPYRQAQFRTAGRLPRSHAEHEAVVREILSGNAGGAHTAMVHHMTLVESAFEAYAAATAA